MSSQRKPINSLGFYLISNSWKNPRWRPCLVSSQASSSAITGFQLKAKSFRNTATFQNLRKGVPSTPPSPPNPLVPRWGRTLNVGPRVKVKWFYFSYSSSHLKDKKKATVICLKMSTDGTKNIWFAVSLTEFIVISIINAFTLIVFARSRHLRRRNTYLIMNLTVADLLCGAAAGLDTLWFLKTGKRSTHGLRVLYLMIADICWIASLSNLALISLERLLAILYPFRHCLVGKRIYYKTIIFSWLGALILACVLHITRMTWWTLRRSIPLDNLYFSYPCSTNNILCYNYFKIYQKSSCAAVRVSYVSRKKTFSNFIHS